MASVAGVIEGYQEKLFRAGNGGAKGSGGKAAFFEIEDMRGRVRAKVRGDRVDLFSPLLTSGEPVLVSGKISFPMTEDPSEEKEATLLVDDVTPLLESIRKATTAICIPLKAQEMQPARLRQLGALLEQMPGPCPVDINIEVPDGTRVLMGLEGRRVDLQERVLGGLERVFPGCIAELR
jgi:DNA polymerase-3 subunit alpha